MNTRTMAIVAGLILGWGMWLPGAARRASGDGLKPAPTTSATSAGAVGELKVNIKEWDVPTKGAHPHDPAVAPDGSLWFTEQLQNKLGRLDPASGTVKEYALQVEESGPHGLVADARGEMWCAENGKGEMGKRDPQSGETKVYKVPESARPRRMAINAEDKIYFTDYNGGNLGRLDPATGAVKMWPSPSGAGAAPYGITITPDGMVWYSESGVRPNTMVRFDPKTEQFARAAIPSGGGTGRNMAATPDGRGYIACSGVNKVGVVQAVREGDAGGRLETGIRLLRKF